VAHDFFVDKTMFKGRELTLREGSKIIENHIKFAAAIGCPIIRIGGTFDPELFRLAAPVCEDYGVKLGIEIHSGASSWVLPAIQKLINLIGQINSPYLGIIPDMSMFQTRLLDSHMAVGMAKRVGMDDRVIDDMKRAFEGGSLDDYRALCFKRIDESPDENVRRVMRVFSYVEKHDPKELAELMHLVIHVHGKFWEMDENNEETQINYRDILPIFVNSGYDGYISAEFEGRLMPGQDPFEPQMRFQKMLDRYLGSSYPSFPEVKARPPAIDIQCLSSRGFKNLRNEKEEITGVEIYVRSFYYRGIPLCLVDDIEVRFDGVKYGVDKISFKVDGEVFGWDEMKTVTSFYWNYGYTATVIVDLPGGLDENRKHEVYFRYAIRTYYLPFNMGGEATLMLGPIQ
jgi:hypothetical protein